MCRNSALFLLMAVYIFGACGGDESPTGTNVEEPAPAPTPEPDPPHPLVGSWRLTTNNADALVEKKAQDLIDNEGVSPGEALAFVGAVDRAFVAATGISSGCVLTFNQDHSQSNYVEGAYTWCSSSSGRWSHITTARGWLFLDELDKNYRFAVNSTPGEVEKLHIVFNSSEISDHIDEQYKPWFSTVLRDISDLDDHFYTLGVVFTFERI